MQSQSEERRSNICTGVLVIQMRGGDDDNFEGTGQRIEDKE
jgi:hypothetical protein